MHSNPFSTRLTISLIVLFLILFTSCKHKQCDEKKQQVKSDKTTANPKSQILPPVTVLLDTCPMPNIISVPKVNGGSYIKPSQNRVKQTELKPPITTSLPIVTRTLDGAEMPDQSAAGLGFFTTYTTENGLALDAVYCSYMDHFGNLWFGTAGGGVSRFDGKSFTNFTTSQGLANNIVLSITEDKMGNLWFGTKGGGVSCYNGKSFTNYTTLQGLANNLVSSIKEDKAGNIWFGTYGGGASRYDGKSFTNYDTSQGMANNEVLSITEDRTGNLWFGTAGGGISRYNGKSFMNFTTLQGLANNIVRSIIEDKMGNLWFGTNGGGVSCYDGKSFKNYTVSQGIANNEVLSIAEDKTGNLWFGTNGSGVSCYNGKSFTNYSTLQGLANNVVRSITNDKMGNLWLGTEGGGINRYDGKSFTNYTVSQGLSNIVILSVAEDRAGNLWLGSDGGGVSCFNGKSFINFTTSQGLASNSVWSIMEDRTGNLWFGTDGGGLSCYDGKSFTNFTTLQGLANNRVLCITKDKIGNLWFGTYGGGVSRFNGKSFTNFTTLQGLANNEVLCVCEDKTGKMWFGTAGSGVSCFDGESFTNFTTSQGLTNNLVVSIMEDKTGNLWFGTDGGITVLLHKYVQQWQKYFMSSYSLKEQDTKSNNLKKSQDDSLLPDIFFNITSKNGLPDNFVTQIAQTKEGTIYAGTNFGICELIPTPDGKYKVGSVYNSATGYPVKDVNEGQNTMFIDSKGVFWIATGSDKTGLVRFDYKAIHKNSTPPTVVIQSIRVNEENICWYDMKLNSKEDKATGKPATVNVGSSDSIILSQQEIMTFGMALSQEIRDSIRKKFAGIRFDSITSFYPLPINLVLPYEHNNITFEFNAIEPGRHFSVRYQYILEGYNKEWSPVTEKTSATFGNIYDGTYTFKLKACNPDGIWSNPITYTFKVLPPWYRTWWMYSIYIIVIISVLFLVYRWRVASLRRRQKELVQEVRKVTAEIRKQNEEIILQRDEIDLQKKKSDELLLNILPSETAEELKKYGRSNAKPYDVVSVLFTDFEGFSKIAEKFSAEKLVTELSICFEAFDKLMEKYNVEKIKTIGDSYMCAGGIPVPNTTNPVDVVKCGLEIQQFMETYKEERIKKNEPYFELRIGIHTGPIVAGIVGLKKFSYDIWGDTVNIASRMESSGEVGKVNISGTTYELVKDIFVCTYRGKVQAKNKGEIDMYFVEKIITK